MRRSSLVAVAVVTAVVGSGACGGPAEFDGLDESVGSTETAQPLITGFKVLTRSYNNARTGANLAETVLSTLNVGTSQFGKRFEMPVNGQLYAGLLYTTGLNVKGATNVVYAATTNNFIYAFNADTGANLWTTQLADGALVQHQNVGKFDSPLTPPSWCNPYLDFDTNIGIVGTPVIDDTQSPVRMFFVSRGTSGSATQPGDDGNYHQYLHSVDVTTGLDIARVEITASVNGTGQGASGGMVSFNPRRHNQRAALAIAGNNVYIAWSGHCDAPVYRGWVLAYAKDTLAQTVKYSTAANGTQVGIWGSGGGPVVDGSNNVYYSTGNGFGLGGGAGSQNGVANSLIKISPSGTVTPYTPSGTFNTDDFDFGSGSPSMIPGTNTLITGTKFGTNYLVNSSNMSFVQSFQAVGSNFRPGTPSTGVFRHIHSTNVLWQGPSGTNVYTWGENDVLRAYRFNGTTFGSSSILNGSDLSPGTMAGMPGGFMTLSSSGTTANTAIVWTTAPTSENANQKTVKGSFRAYVAQPSSGSTLAKLFDSGPDTSSQYMGNFAKYNPPLVAQGKVFVPTFSNKISVYGLGTAPTQQSPFNGTRFAVPSATIQAEQFDLGGEGVAYHDNEATNQGGAGALRASEGVDIEATTDTGGGNDVGWTVAGEWLEYMVNVTGSPNTVALRVASAGTGTKTIRLEVDPPTGSGNGTTIATGSFAPTGGWQTFTTLNVPVSNLNAGDHVIRLVFVTGDINLNHFKFGSGTPTGSTPFNGTPFAVPGPQIEAEQYDLGGEGVAFHDMTSNNQGTVTSRGDAVDIGPTGSPEPAGSNIGWTAPTEWLNYSVNVTGTVSTMTLRVASASTPPPTGTNKTMHVESDGVNISGTISFAPTGGWQTYTTLTRTLNPPLTAGPHRIRVVFDSNEINLNWIDF